MTFILEFCFTMFIKVYQRGRNIFFTPFRHAHTPIPKYPLPLENRNTGTFCSDSGVNYPDFGVIWCAISPFYSDWPPFYRDAAPFCSSFQVNLCEVAQKRSAIAPFSSNVSPFSSDIAPFYSDIAPFYSSIPSFYWVRLSLKLVNPSFCSIYWVMDVVLLWFI